MQGLGAWDDAHIPGLNRLATAIQAGGAAAALQLFHAGAKTYGDELPPVGASGIALRAGMAPRPLTAAELGQVVEDFAQAARRAAEAGFDTIEIHAAHFYLLSEFLSPFTNRRDDDYGGDPQRRARLAVEVVRAVRSQLGTDFPLLLRLHGSERCPGGLSPAGVLTVARLLAAAGVDCFNVSMANQFAVNEQGGSVFYSLRPYLTKEQPAGSAANQAGAIRRVTGLPVIAVGKLGDPAVAERVLAAGEADLVGVGRNFLADPALATKMLAGRADEIVRCRECFVCLTRTVVQQRPIRCAVNKALGSRAPATLAGGIAAPTSG